MTEVDESQALLAVVQTLMAPLAKLLVARGVPFASAEECLKIAMIDAARDAHPEGLPHRLVSRISTTTGINRREVTRLSLPSERPAGPPRYSVAQALFARWRTTAGYVDERGAPRTLARQGEAPSFEALARSVTQDVHPRSLLDELLRLGVARHDLERDTVAITLGDFLPSSDRVRMLDFLANNVGDHLSAAVENVVGAGPKHLERAIFASEMSSESIDVAEAWVAEAWKRMLAELTPMLERLVAQDEADPTREANRRFRAGMYVYDERDRTADRPPAVADEAPAVEKEPARKAAAKGSKSISKKM